MPSTSPSPILQDLQKACEANSLAAAEKALDQITPLPPVPDTNAIPPKIHIALQECLRTAVVKQHPDIVRAMLTREGGFLPYHFSCLGVDATFHAHDIAMFKVFVECGWDVNEAGPGTTMRPLLRHAVNDADLRCFLLEHGASPHVSNGRGTTALETAVGWSTLEVVRELLEYGSEPPHDDSLVLAAEAGRIEVAELLLERGWDVNGLEKMLPHPWGQGQRRTPLMAARAHGRQDMVQWLQSRGATS